MKNFLYGSTYLNISFLLLFFVIQIFELEGKPNMYQELSNKDKQIYQFIDHQAEILGKKYNIKLCGKGLKGMDKILAINLSFEKVGSPHDEIEARSLILSCLNDFLKAVNFEEKLKPFLNDYPFTAKNINLDIYFFNYDRSEQTYPNISVVGNKEGRIKFLSVDPQNKYEYCTKKYELFEESQAIVKDSNPFIN